MMAYRIAIAAVAALWCCALMTAANAEAGKAEGVQLQLPGDLCNAQCKSSADCQTDPNNACVFCVANNTGALGCTDSACGAACATDNDCDPLGGQYSCPFCLGGVCGQGNCNAGCQNNSDCAYTPQPPSAGAQTRANAIGVPVPVTCPYCFEGSCNTTPFPDCGQPCNATVPCPAPALSPCSDCFDGFCLNPSACGKSCSSPPDCSDTRGSECAFCSAGSCSSNACGAVCRNGTDCANSQCEGCYKGSCVPICGMACEKSSDCYSQDSDCEFCVNGQCAVSPCPAGLCSVVQCNHSQCGCVVHPEKGAVCEFVGPE